MNSDFGLGNTVESEMGLEENAIRTQYQQKAQVILIVGFCVVAPGEKKSMREYMDFFFYYTSAGFCSLQVGCQ